jgi:hypothetical protein
MKYIVLLLLLVFVLASCKKDYHYNPFRSMMLGNYHFYIYNLGSNTIKYNGTITVPNPDNGNSIIMTYPDSGRTTVFNTSDSSFSGGHGCGLSSTYEIFGNYFHDTINITDYSFNCSLYTTTIGIKY